MDNSCETLDLISHHTCHSLPCFTLFWKDYEHQVHLPDFWMAQDGWRGTGITLAGFQRCFLSPQGHQTEHPLQSKAAELAFWEGWFWILVCSWSPLKCQWDGTSLSWYLPSLFTLCNCFTAHSGLEGCVIHWITCVPVTEGIFLINQILFQL